MSSSGGNLCPTSSVDLSIVIPVFNEAPNLPLLHAELREVLAGLPRRAEIIFVDDASEDGSAATVRGIAAADPRVRLLRLGTHAGLTAAFAAGFGAARGPIVVTLDGDLQNDPRDIPRLLAHLDEADLVQGRRAQRHDPVLKRLSSRLFNGVRNLVLDERVTDAACSLRAMRRRCLADLVLFDGSHRFMPSLFRMHGWRVVEVSINHRPRHHGVSKFGLRNRAWRALSDLLAVRWMKTHRLAYQVLEERRGGHVQGGADVAGMPELGHRSRAPHPALALVVLWALVGLALGGWGTLARPTPGDHPVGRAGEFSVLEQRPAARILTLWVHWDAPRGAVGWVVLEPGRAWSAPGETYWRRRVHPGWNQLLWDDFSGFPAGAPVRLRVLDGQGGWSVAPATTSSTYTLVHLWSLRGLLAALVLGAGAAGVLLWRGLRSPEPAAPRSWHLALIAVAGVAIVLRLHTLTTQSFWFDEVLTAIGAQSFAWVLYSPEIFGHPPMQYLVGWAMGGAQATEGWLRAPFVAAGVAGVVAVGYLGRRLFGTSTGLLAAGLLAVSPFHIELSQLARPYALLVLGVVLSLLALFRALERGAPAEWVCFSAVAALSVYTHYAAGILLLVEALVAVTWVARRRGEGGLRVLVSFSAIAVLLAPWAAVLGRFAGTEVGGGQVSVALLGEILTGALIPQLIGSGLCGAVTGALIPLGLWALRRRPEVALAAVLSLTLPLGMLWATNPAHFLAGRHFAFVLPVLVLVVAHGLVSAVGASGIAVMRVLGSHRGWTRRAGAAFAAAVLILATNVPASASLGGYYRWRHGADWRTVAAVLNRLVTPGDEVVATLGAAYPLRYYWGRTVTEIDGRALWERYRRDPSGRRLWIITLEGWDWAPELHHWLGAHAIQVGEVAPSWSLPRVYIHRARGAFR